MCKATEDPKGWAGIPKIIPSKDGRDEKKYEVSKEGREKFFNQSLAAACRAAFAIHVEPLPQFVPGTTGTKRTRCVWKSNMTLAEFLDGEFPATVEPDMLSGRFKKRLLSLRNLVRHADITVDWTPHPDHLMLIYEDDKKVLRLFNLPCLVEALHEASKFCKRTASKPQQRHTSAHFPGEPRTGTNEL
ncbi:hypothetical protein OOU_Y34scaffold01152g6 [Pyricularia oryzae Y34]|uniref:Uncharacterized protein n=1 Tax=Pyricularia oryzae (strain Y34) TaxID=1143189 RepID=A0AA97NLR1_PYRO3|nr:hypothetical protein OOU_Y34scaffold01152g6 [Pyricularia oryzae Y34]